MLINNKIFDLSFHTFTLGFKFIHENCIKNRNDTGTVYTGVYPD